MKLAIFASLIAGAAAFAPAAQTVNSATALNAKKADWKATSPYKDEIGAMAPLGFFDPMGLLEDAPQERFDRLRYLEIKHGRVCMLAFTGYIVTAAGIRLPGYLSFSADIKYADMPCGLAAFPAMPGAGIIQMIAFILLLEMSMRDATGNSEFIGDYRNDYIDFGWDKYNDATKLKKRTIELNQGRAAMMGITGLVTHEMMGNLDAILPGQ